MTSNEIPAPSFVFFFGFNHSLGFSFQRFSWRTGLSVKQVHDPGVTTNRSIFDPTQPVPFLQGLAFFPRTSIVININSYAGLVQFQRICFFDRGKKRISFWYIMYYNLFRFYCIFDPSVITSVQFGSADFQFYSISINLILSQPSY